LAGRARATGMTDGHLRGEPPRTRTARQVDVLAAFVETGGSVADAATRAGAPQSATLRDLAADMAIVALRSEPHVPGFGSVRHVIRTTALGAQDSGHLVWRRAKQSSARALRYCLVLDSPLVRPSVNSSCASSIGYA
jgi:hypothetical protein